MTREEAKNILLNAAWLGSNADRERIEEAVRMAVEALSSSEIPNSSDTIYRQDAIDAVANMLRRKFGIGGDLAEITLSNLPSAQKTQLSGEDATSDCISRQAAIDVCDNAIDLWHGQLGEGIVIAVKKKIEELPSAQSNVHDFPKDADCISRQDAIDAMGKAEWAKERLRELPAAQPIIRCKDCKHYDARRDVCHNPAWGDGWANYPPPTVYEDYFCSRVERRTDEAD